MDLKEFSRQVDAMQARLRGWPGFGEAGAVTSSLIWEEATEALAVSMEEMRVAEEELRTQNEELAQSRWEIEEERRRYRELFDFAPDAYLVTDLHGMIREANRAARMMLGDHPNSQAVWPLSSYIPFDERPAFRSGLCRLIEAGRRSGWLLRIKPRRGEPIQAEITAEVSRDAEGRPVAVRWMIREVAGLIGTLWPEALATAPGDLGGDADRIAYLRDLVDGAGMIVWEAEATSGGYRFISPRAEQMLGYPAERWLSDPSFWWSIIHPDDRRAARERRLQYLREGGHGEQEYRVIAEGARVIWFREYCRLLREEAGRPAVLRGCLWDITRRKKVERQLYADRRNLAERLSDVSYLYNLEGQLLTTTDLVPVLEEVLGAVASLVGAEMGATRLFDRDRRSLELVASLGLPPEYLEAYRSVPIGVDACGLAAERGEPVIVEDIACEPAASWCAESSRMGEYRSYMSVPIRARGGEINGAVVAYFRDPHRPTPRQIELVEQYLARASDAVDNARRLLALRESDRRKEEFLATLAHELRNPLATIRNWVDLLTYAPESPETTADARAVICRQTNLMLRLVDDLFDAARMFRGTIALRKERVDIVALAARAAEDLRPLFAARDHQLEVWLPSEPLWLDADATRLVQALTNLLTNAARYTDPGGRIDLIATRDPVDGAIVIRVRDTGIGMAPEALARIFDLFGQVDPGQDRARGGLGIGLALVRTVIELHGGTVTADSPGPGRGSEFIIRLPAEEPAVHDPADQSRSAQQA